MEYQVIISNRAGHLHYYPCKTEKEARAMAKDALNGEIASVHKKGVTKPLLVVVGSQNE